MEVSAEPDDPLTLRFGEEVIAPDPDRRRAADLRPVLQEPEAARPDDTLYTIYRGIAPRGEIGQEINRRGLLYVALAMRPGTIGLEWARTRGHVNSSAASTPIPFPEVHEVWQGRALLYLQREAAPEVSDTVFLTLEAGDKAVIAPGWASLIANIGDGPLILGSWRTFDVKPQYDALTALGGMAHFLLRDTNAFENCRFAPNPRYRTVAAPRRIPAHDISDFGLKHDEPMLTTFRRNPDFLRFMLRPQDYDRIWASLYREA